MAVKPNMQKALLPNASAECIEHRVRASAKPLDSRHPRRDRGVLLPRHRGLGDCVHRPRFHCSAGNRSALYQQGGCRRPTWMGGNLHRGSAGGETWLMGSRSIRAMKRRLLLNLRCENDVFLSKSSNLASVGFIICFNCRGLFVCKLCFFVSVSIIKRGGCTSSGRYSKNIRNKGFSCSVFVHQVMHNV